MKRQVHNAFTRHLGEGTGAVGSHQTDLMKSSTLVIEIDRPPSVSRNQNIDYPLPILHPLHENNTTVRVLRDTALDFPVVSQALIEVSDRTDQSVRGDILIEANDLILLLRATSPDLDDEFCLGHLIFPILRMDIG